MSNETRFLPSWMLELDDTNRVKIKEKTEEFVEFDGLIYSSMLPNTLASYAEEILAQIDSCKTIDVVYGFDMEWPVTYLGRAKKTALIQICTDYHSCYLFQVYDIQVLPSIFVHLINHPRVRWSGVCIKNDFIKLGKDFNIDVSTAISRIIDLGSYANSVLNFDSGYRWSMVNLVKGLLKKNVSKDPNIRMGNWDNSELDQNQLIYAATDAYISLILYEHLKSLDKRKNEH